MVFDSREFLFDIEHEKRWVGKKETGSQNFLFNTLKKLSITVTFLLGQQTNTIPIDFFQY